MQHVTGLNHYTITCRTEDLESLRDFYTSVLGLVDGSRPDFGFDGNWLYADDQPIVHLAALREDQPPATTGPLEHLAFSGSDLQRTLQHLDDLSIDYEQAPVPERDLWQVFVRDPLNIRIELTFPTAPSAS